jgi:peptide/nickel transport system substrate-binding protein
VKNIYKKGGSFMKKSKFTAVLCILVGFALVLSGCGGAQTPNEEGTNKAVITTKAGEVTAGTGQSDKDNLIFVMNSEPNSLEPGASSSSDTFARVALIQVYETLLREAVGDRTTLEPLIANSWEFKNDGLQVVFEIKDGIKFHNGDDLTVEDVAFSLNKAIAMPTISDVVSMMENAEILDDSHVALNLKYAYSPVLNILTNPAFSIISKEYYEKCQEDGTNFGRKPVGTGPYKFVSWQNGANIKYEANDNWHKGDVNIKNLEIRFMSDVTTAAIALESGDCDVFYGVDSADLPRLRENKDVNVLSVQSSGFYFIALNTDRPPLDNLKVRQAISYAINRQEIIDGGQDGVGWVTECPITPGIFGYQEEFKAHEQDIEKAKSLLAEAGYSDGLQIEMKTPEAAYYARPAQVIQEQLRQIGITVNLLPMERATFNTDVANRDYDSIYTWIGATIPDADNIVYNLFNSEYAHTTGVTNMANIKDTKADEIINKARKSIDRDERYRLYGELSQLNKDNAWYIPILTSTNTLCARVDVKGAYGNSAAYFYVSDWSF